MKNTINIKRIVKEELNMFKSRPDIYIPNLELSKNSILLLTDVTEEFIRNLIKVALNNVNLEKRLMPIFINDLLNKRLDIQFIDSIVPKPRDISIYSYKPRKPLKTGMEFNISKNDNLTFQDTKNSIT